MLVSVRVIVLKSIFMIFYVLLILSIIPTSFYIKKTNSLLLIRSRYSHLSYDFNCHFFMLHVLLILLSVRVYNILCAYDPDTFSGSQNYITSVL